MVVLLGGGMYVRPLEGTCACSHFLPKTFKLRSELAADEICAFSYPWNGNVEVDGGIEVMVMSLVQQVDC